MTYYQIIKNRGIKGSGIEIDGINVIKPWKISKNSVTEF